MSDYSQMLKGILEGCILAIIAEKEIYGYELSSRLKREGFDMVSEGSIYPLLLRMEKAGWIGARMADSPSGPQRKYYHLTGEGQRVLNQFRQQWRMIRTAVEHVLHLTEKKPNEEVANSESQRMGGNQQSLA